MRKITFIILIIFTLLFVSSVNAQDVTVPDLTGLNVPQAAAALNSLGLAMGQETAILPAVGAEGSTGTIANQAVAPGSAVAAGTAIDVGVHRNNNIILVYDDNDFTLINTTNNVGNVTGLRFAAVAGANPASFAANRWGSNVREQRCLQVWSVAVRDSKPVRPCQDIQWISTRESGEHFWTAANGVVQFAVIEDGLTRATCDAAPVGSQNDPSRCEFYLSGAGSADDITSYLYLVYTTNSIAIVNQAPNLWMPTDRTTIYNIDAEGNRTSSGVIMGDPVLFGSPEIVADITSLAPNQCIVLTTGDGTVDLTSPCTIIAQQAVGAETAFWMADFELESASDAQDHKCPAASAERPTICIVPQ